MKTCLHWGLLSICVASISATASAENGVDYGPALPAAPAPMALIIQGGVSLGAFEAGALNYLTAVLAANRFLATPRVITGTSAGSINGFLSALAICGHSNPIPEKSIFWKTWHPIGLEGLFDPEAVTPTAVLTRDGVMNDVAASLAKSYAEGLSEDCDVVIGIPVTRVDARKVRLDADGNLPLSRVEERFTLRIRGRGKGKAPSMQNYLDPDSPAEHVAVATDGRGEVPFSNLMALLHASSGIPGAFRPVPIPHCLVSGGTIRSRGAASGRRVAGFGPVVCTLDDAESAEVVDGGFLDNQPLRLAAHVLGRGVDANGRLKDRPSGRIATLPANTVFLALDPTSMPWAPDPPPAVPEEESLAETLGRLLPSLLEAARTSELQTIIEEHPEMSERLAVMQSDWPTASGVLGAFMGFMEADFRAFDFYLGMHEGKRAAEALIKRWATPRGLKVTFPDPTSKSSEATREAWRPLRCLESMLSGKPDIEGATIACAGDNYANFRAILQTTIDRLHARCRNLSAEVAALLPLSRLTNARNQCISAYARAPVPRVPGLEGASPMEPTTDPDGVNFFFDRLSAYGFDYKDLGVGKADAKRARRRLAYRITRVTRALAAAQPTSSLLYLSGARLLGHEIAYSPPAHALHVLGGSTWELGWSVTDDESELNVLRFATALQFEGLSTLTDGESRAWFALTPLMGIEFEPRGVSDAYFQFRMGLRGGFRFASSDSFTHDLAGATPGLPRSRPIVTGHIAGTFAQWIRLQIDATWLPGFDGLSNLFSLRAMVGVELDLPL